MNRKKTIQIILVIALTFAIYRIADTEPVSQYVSSVKNDVEPTHEQEQLKEKIAKLADKHRENPENARIDTIWKAIPGYNGLEVDIEKTYEKVKEKGTVTEENLQFRQIPPAVSLEDLDPAPIYRGNPKKPMVSFMVNVAWGNEYLPSILDTFDRYHIQTTFFLDGSWLKKNADLAEEIMKRGHEIGNHAYSHPNMSRLSAQQITNEIVSTNKLIEQTLGVRAHLFAPPSGDYNQQVVMIANRLGMKTILWTLDTVDWRKPKPETIIQRLQPQLENGSLILMHPTASSAAALPQLIEAAQKKGLLPGKVSELLSSSRIP